MKKILAFLTIFISIFAVNIYADENLLYFEEVNNKLYYDSSLIDENLFIKHLDMIPGKSFTDVLKIQNGTSTDYTLYFRVIELEQSEEADELLDNINMEIYLDNVLIYDGKAKGLDYSDEGVNLQNAIKLKLIESNSSSTMRVITTLDSTYENKENDALSYIDWEFYAQYDKEDPKQIVKAASTGQKTIPLFIIGISIFVIGLTLILISRDKKKEV